MPQDSPLCSLLDDKRTLEDDLLVSFHFYSVYVSLVFACEVGALARLDPLPSRGRALIEPRDRQGEAELWICAAFDELPMQWKCFWLPP